MPSMGHELKTAFFRHIFNVKQENANPNKNEMRKVCCTFDNDTGFVGRGKGEGNYNCTRSKGVGKI